VINQQTVLYGERCSAEMSNNGRKLGNADISVGNARITRRK